MRPAVFPFAISEASTGDPSPEAGSRQFVVEKKINETDNYGNLFRAFGFSGNGNSWAEHIEAIVEEENPELLDHLEFAAEARTFRVYADSRAAVNRFTALLCPIFADLAKLRKYFSTLDAEDFFE